MIGLQGLAPTLCLSQNQEEQSIEELPLRETMGCNMCVVNRPEEQYRIMFQVMTDTHTQVIICLHLKAFVLTRDFLPYVPISHL